ncbi:hypothetical protein NEOLEDRAFT_1180032 [Neolentinus lepideus HHB14362 ss-1]|uniref:G-patch domain-containing protein n=1 Tax=Neolentinus lepideus HHB14362 ss-1 TaxID=1314782 RepID=A0A165RC21_9AGAM|nr:hypothetical protein NEOLEDRAFT_1180032 [Neolentinus lepideus HHB14362 ss-1]
MGLSGRKQKQRIPHDPRNLSWADNAAKFGQAYLQKFGWDTSKGLGANSDGRTSHIKVTQKLDMMGVGAQHQKDPNGIAWKQQNEFERLLQRLNAGSGDGENADGGEGMDTKVGGFVKTDKSQDGENAGEKRKKRDEEGGEVKRKKKRRTDDEDAASAKRALESDDVAGASESERKEKEKKKRDREGKREKSGKKHKKKKIKKIVLDEETVDDKSSSDSSSDLVTAVVVEKKIVSVRPMAHRARLIRSKRMAYQNSAAVSEILGISRSATQTPATATPVEDTLSSPSIDILHPLTTSSKSVMDYFKEKLLAKSSSGRGTPTESGSDASLIVTPGLGMSRQQRDDDDDATPRMGLGARSMMSMFTLPSSSVDDQASALPSEDTPAEKGELIGGDDEETSKRKKKTEKKGKREKKEKKSKES